MSILFNFYDELFIEVEGPSAIRTFCHKFRRYTLRDKTDGEESKTLKITANERIETGELSFLGKEAAWDDRFYILDKGGKKLLFDPPHILDQQEIRFESGFDENLFMSIIESIIMVRLLSAGIVPVHASSTELSGRGLLFPAWAGTGKTRLLLRMVSSGARYVSDEWSFLKGTTIMPYRVDCLMLDYDLREFPEQAGLTAVDRIKLLIGDTFSSHPNVIRVLHRLGLTLPFREIEPEKLFSASTAQAELDTLYLLQKWNGREMLKEEIDRDRILDKLSLSFYREHRQLFYYYTLFKFATAGKSDVLDDLVTIYQERLAGIIQDRACFRLKLPLQVKELATGDL